MNVDKHGIERVFQEGDLVYLKLKPYRKSYLKTKGAEKLQPPLYGPYKILRKIGEAAYELELPLESKIDNVVHVSFLKKVVGQKIILL